MLKAEQWVLHPQNPEFGSTQTASETFSVTSGAKDEAVIGHHKTDMGADMAVLRSKTPKTVAQEKTGDFPARKDRPGVARVTRRLQIHCLPRNSVLLKT